MALDAELINLKSAGTYRFERDKSEISNEVATISNLRLVAGFSKTGPFNTVKLVTSTAQFIKLYGNIDRSLEKKGSFFHRSALVALSTGPILCLNLLNLDPDRDQVVEKTFSVSSGDVNRLSVTLPLQSLYNTDKFWFTSEEAYLDAVEKCLGESNVAGVNNSSTPSENEPGRILKDDAGDTSVDWASGILHISNVGKKPVSVLIKKASDYSSKGFQLTLNEWYGEGNVPEYLNGTSYVSDYLVEVYVVGGDFGPALTGTPFTSSLDLDEDSMEGEGETLTMYNIYKDETDTELPYKRFASDIVYQSYYDENGFIRGVNDSNLVKFLNLPSVDLRAKYVGSLIPNFTDKLGRNIWIQKLINDDSDTIGLVCAENINLLEDVDLDHDFVDEKIDLIGHNVWNNVLKNMKEDGTFTVPDMSFDYLGYKFKYTDVPQEVKVYGMDSDVTAYTIYRSTPEANGDNTEIPSDHPYAWVNVDNEDDVVYADSSYLKVGAKVYREKKEEENNPEVYATQSSNLDSAESDAEQLYDEFVVAEIVKDVKPLVTEFKFMDNKNKFLDTDNKNAYVPRDNEVILDKYADVVVGDYLVSDFYNDDEGKKHSRLTRVVEVRNIYNDDAQKDPVSGKVVKPASKVGILVICADKIDKSLFNTENNSVIKVTSIDKIADHFQWTCLNGFQVSKEAMPDGTNERQNEILDMLREYPEYPSTRSNLFSALIDRDYVQWRYLVDTFGLGIEEECKKVYTMLCQARKSAFAIVNCPSQLDFKKSHDPWFTNKSGGVEVEYIAKGGDLSRNPSFLFTLPKIENGASWGAYYYPYLRITDLSAPKSVPPAAYVSNLFIQKYNRGFAWSIVAGQKRGVISGNQVVGVEATLVHENRDWLEPMGINAIIWEQGVGVEVYGNKTAKQTPVSALSSVHVREAAIYIQDSVETILRRYVFEFNTAQTRMEIKTLVDEFLENMKNNGGLYDYRTVMDTTNNTPEVIDRNMGVIDIYVEIVRGLEIIAQRLTILRTGAIAAGGFDE